MTGDKIFLKDYQAIVVGHVTFRDGVKGRVLEKGALDVDGLPKLKSVLHVEGLKTNLISISQLCDQNLLVKFTKNMCKVFNDSQEYVLEGARSIDNCYKLLQSHTCPTTSFDEIEIWHQMLGHLNYKNLTKIVNTGAIRGIPKLGIKKNRVCGPCQLGKQLKVSHKVLQQVTTTKILELLHMDLIGPMQVESIGGKKYIFVCVDDFSKFTLIDFIKEKSDTFNVFEKLCLKLRNEKNINIGKIVRTKSDHGKEFEDTV